jgi:hypothetical protein
MAEVKAFGNRVIGNGVIELFYHSGFSGRQ